MAGMDLDRLNHLVCLAEARSFNRAAERCGLSQSAFSRSIQTSEEEMGQQLFDRSRRDIVCTDAGTVIVERARQLLQRSRDLERDIGLYRELQTGRLAIGAGPYSSETLMPEVMAEMRLRFPGVQLHVEVNDIPNLGRHLRAGLLDFYVADRRHALEQSDLQIEMLTPMAGGLFVRAGHPLLAKGAAIHPSDWLPYGFATAAYVDTAWLRLGEYLGLPEGERLPMVVGCNNLHLLIDLALCTDTVIIAPLAMREAAVGNERLVRIEQGASALLTSEMAIISPAGRSPSPLVRFATGLIARMAREAAVPA